ncbi:hypothetical protein GGI42DRAFT_327084 [Trichoderma sp. SZMC 28013]
MASRCLAADFCIYLSVCLSYFLHYAWIVASTERWFGPWLTTSSSTGARSNGDMYLVAAVQEGTSRSWFVTGIAASASRRTTEPTIVFFFPFLICVFFVWVVCLSIGDKTAPNISTALG